MKAPLQHDTILSLAFREALLHVKQKGFSGNTAREVALEKAARVASRLLGRPVSPDDVTSAIPSL